MAVIEQELSDNVLTVTLNRPERLNAIVDEMYDGLFAAMDRADRDDDVRALIVTGAGRGFCSGRDLGTGEDTFDYPEGKAHRDGGGLLTLRMYECTVPIIGAINGAAVGVGATMTLPMDVRLASTAAKFGFVFARRGIVPEACSSWFLPRVVGISKAMEWVSTGRVFDADEALAAGLVRSVHEPDALLPAARALAHEIVANTSPLSVSLTRQMMWRLHAADHPMAAHEVESRALEVLGRSADVRSAIAAFRAGEAPVFGATLVGDPPPFYPWWPERGFTPVPDRADG